MDRRPEVQNMLEALFTSQPHVYFQPPENFVLKYPCIVYSLNDIPTRYANNSKYLDWREYQLTVIDRDPDSTLREKVVNLNQTKYIRHYVKDGLNHFIFSLFH